MATHSQQSEEDSYFPKQDKPKEVDSIRKNDAMEVKVDLSRPEKPKVTREKKRFYFPIPKVPVSLTQNHPLRAFFLFGGAFFLIVLISFGAYAYNITTNNIITSEDQEGVFGQIYRILDENVEPLAGEEEGRINILLMGQGGIEHPGGTLVDTVMIASIDPNSNKVSLLSLPRDMVIPYNPAPETCGDACLEYRKLNYMMNLGGVDFAKKTIKEVTGLTIHYYIQIDFAGFRQVIDTLGGIDVYVENSFTDYQYPDYNFGYQTINFEEGPTTFTGEQALQYSRSRHGNNGEGSDFARARRQQIVLEGVRNKVLSASTLLNPTKISGLLNDLGERVSTDIELWEFARFVKLAQNVDRESIINDVIDNSEDGELYSEISSETGAYILIPRAGLGDYSDIKAVAQNAFEVQKTLSEDSLVTIQNGSSLNGIADKTSKILRSNGIAINGVGNANVKTVESTVIYDLTNGQKTETEQILMDTLNAPVVPSILPGGIDGDSRIRLGSELDTSVINAEILPKNVDFIVLLGSDYYRLAEESLNDTTDELSTNDL